MIGTIRRCRIGIVSAILLTLAITPDAFGAGFQSPLTEPLTGGHRGGVLTVIDETDFEDLDPGQAANIEGTRVRGVGDLWDVGEWDYSWTSLR
jgi:hypothetical protein